MMSLTASSGCSRTAAPVSWSRDRNARTPDYEPLAFAGAGAFCDVWQVRELATGAVRALKQLRPEHEVQRVARQLLENEAEAGRRLTSPHIARVIEARLEVAPRFLVMEWLTGQTLEQLLAARGALPCRQALWVARQCAQGMADLAAAGLAHGDVKPTNIFVECSGVVRLIDLGFARPVEPAATADRLLTGTPEYLAPESLGGEFRPPIEKDIYSLGVVLYRMLCGRLPFVGDTVEDVLRQHQQAIPRDLRRAAPHVPREVADLTTRLLAKHPLRRGDGLPHLVHDLARLELAAFAAVAHSGDRPPRMAAMDDAALG